MSNARENLILLAALLTFVLWACAWPALGAWQVARIAERIAAAHTQD